jgi:hypothetical protein
MSDVTLETLNRRTAIAAVRQEAARIGADGEALLDSKRLYDQVTSLDPEDAGFVGRVREIVGEAAGRTGRQPEAEQRRDGAARQDKQERPPQWTIDDVRRSTPSQCAAALEAGLLVDLGAPPTRRRR